MKPILAVFSAVALLTLAAEVFFGTTIIQITLGFAHPSFVWQIVSAVLVAFIVSAVFAQVRKPRTAAN